MGATLYRPSLTSCTAHVYCPSFAQYLKELGEAGNGVVHIHSIALWSRVLSSIYANQTAGTFSPPLYSPSDKDKFASMLEDDLNQFEIVHHGVYLGFTTLRRLPNSAHADLQTIWESPVQATHIWVDTYQSHEEIQVRGRRGRWG